MTIKLPDTINRLLFMGDIHGDLGYPHRFLKFHKVENACLILLGDIGFGFNIMWEEQMVNQINKWLVNNNVYLVGVRGNHENSERFHDTSIVKDNRKPLNWINVPDYTIVEVCGHSILCIGGGTSVDRTGRVPYKTYWPNEQVKYQPKIEEYVDIIASHSAPSFVYPAFKGNFVLDWAKHDPDLLKDLDIERQTLDKVYNDYKDTLRYWYYGHFHKSNTEYIDGCSFRLLNIEEVMEHEDYSEM